MSRELRRRVERIEAAFSPLDPSRMTAEEILALAPPDCVGLTVIDDGWAPPLTVEELRARVEGVEWTELDERAAAVPRQHIFAL